MPRKHLTDQPSAADVIPATSDAATAIAEAPPQEPAPPSTGFAQRIEQARERTAAPDPFGVATDNIAGVRLFESRQDRVMAIKFDEKPSAAVLDTLKGAGYRWNARDQVWVHRVKAESARTTRMDAGRLYKDVCAMIREEKGAGSSQEIPF